jgi:hypothetical protein
MAPPNPLVSAEMAAEVDFDRINFLANDRPTERFDASGAAPEQIADATRGR